MNITINIEIPRWIHRLLVPAIGVAVLGATALVWAVPNTFVAGHQLEATELNANFDALEAQLANGCALPVGSLVSSVLTEAQFQTKCGTGWIVADGRSIAGSTLAPLLPTSYAPDARGRFLRGKNNGITSDLGNPDGEVLPGTFQGEPA